MKRSLTKIALLLLTVLVCMAQRPGYGGRTWQLRSTLLTTTPVAISSMVGNPPDASTSVWVCEGGFDTASSSPSQVVTYTSVTDSHSQSFSPWPGTAGSPAIFKVWGGSSTLSCEWMPGGMLVSATGGGVYFKASGVY